MNRIALASTMSAAMLALGTSSQAALVAYYPLNEGTGTIAMDASGNGRNLQFTGANTWLNTGASGGSIQLQNGLLARTGGLQSATVASFNTVTSNAISIAFWADPNFESQGSSVFYIGDNAGGAGNRIAQSHLEWTDGNIYWDATWGDGTNQRVANAGGTVTDTLHHYAFIFNGTTGLMQVYKDANLLVGNIQPTNANFPWASIRNIEFGASSFVSGWGGGQLDEIGIWNQALSAQQVRNAFAAGVTQIDLPEPASASLLALGALALLRRRRTA